jgi:carboxypeptidase C (cathepsin A)
MRSSRRVIGRMDSRFVGPDTDPAGQRCSYDPSLEMLTGTFASAINYYIRNDLKFTREDIPYMYLNYDAGKAWNWRSGINSSQGYVDVCHLLTEAMHINRYLRVFIASGYYDLATPYFAAKYTLSHLQLNPPLNNNITVNFYNAGHMMYINRPSLEKLSRDISLFYSQTPDMSE